MRLTCTCVLEAGGGGGNPDTPGPPVTPLQNLSDKLNCYLEPYTTWIWSTWARALNKRPLQKGHANIRLRPVIRNVAKVPGRAFLASSYSSSCAHRPVADPW